MHLVHFPLLNPYPEPHVAHLSSDAEYVAQFVTVYDLHAPVPSLYCPLHFVHFPPLSAYPALHLVHDGTDCPAVPLSHPSTTWHVAPLVLYDVPLQSVHFPLTVCWPGEHVHRLQSTLKMFFGSLAVAPATPHLPDRQLAYKSNTHYFPSAEGVSQLMQLLHVPEMYALSFFAHV